MIIKITINNASTDPNSEEQSNYNSISNIGLYVLDENNQFIVEYIVEVNNNPISVLSGNSIDVDFSSLNFTNATSTSTTQEINSGTYKIDICINVDTSSDDILDRTRGNTSTIVEEMKIVDYFIPVFPSLNNPNIPIKINIDMMENINQDSDVADVATVENSDSYTINLSNDRTFNVESISLNVDLINNSELYKDSSYNYRAYPVLTINGRDEIYYSSPLDNLVNDTITFNTSNLNIHDDLVSLEFSIFVYNRNEEVSSAETKENITSDIEADSITTIGIYRDYDSLNNIDDITLFIKNNKLENLKSTKLLELVLPQYESLETARYNVNAQKAITLTSDMQNTVKNILEIIIMIEEILINTESYNNISYINNALKFVLFNLIIQSELSILVVVQNVGASGKVRLNYFPHQYTLSSSNTNNPGTTKTLCIRALFEMLSISTDTLDNNSMIEIMYCDLWSNAEYSTITKNESFDLINQNYTNNNSILVAADLITNKL